MGVQSQCVPRPPQTLASILIYVFAVSFLVSAFILAVVGCIRAGQTEDGIWDPYDSQAVVLFSTALALFAIVCVGLATVKCVHDFRLWSTRVSKKYEVDTFGSSGTRNYYPLSAEVERTDDNV